MTCFKYTAFCIKSYSYVIGLSEGNEGFVQNSTTLRYLLVAGAGLQWGATVTHFGFVTTVPSLSLQLTDTVRWLSCAFYVVSFLLFLPLYRRRPEFFQSKRNVVLFSVLLCVGATIEMVLASFASAPNDALMFAFTVIGTIFSRFATSFFNFLIFRAFSYLGTKEKVSNIAASLAVTCALFTLATFFPHMTLQVYYTLLVLFAAVCLALFTLNSRREKGRKRAYSAATFSPLAYFIYGVCTVAAPAIGTLREADLSLNISLLVVLAVAALAGIPLLARKNRKLLLLVEAATMLIGVLLVYALDVPLLSIINGGYIFTYILMCALLSCGLPEGKGRFLDPMFLIIMGYAVGWVVSRLLEYWFFPAFADMFIAKCLIAATIGIAVPLYSIMQGYAASPARSGATVATSANDDAPKKTASDRIEEISHELAAEYQLTNRERDVLVFLAQGFSEQFICEELVISKSTAHTHVKHVYSKFGVHTREELIRLVHERDSRERA